MAATEKSLLEKGKEMVDGRQQLYLLLRHYQLSL
jgi:hypothetical protein